MKEEVIRSKSFTLTFNLMCLCLNYDLNKLKNIISFKLSSILKGKIFCRSACMFVCWGCLGKSVTYRG